VRKKTPYDTFRKRVLEALVDDPKPSEQTLHDLYRVGISARRERLWRRILRVDSRKRRHALWLSKTAKLAEELENQFENRDEDLSPINFKVFAVSAARLAFALRRTQRYEIDLADIRKQRFRTEILRNTRIRMADILKKPSERLSGGQRNELISLAIETVGLKKDESEVAVRKALDRAKKRSPSSVPRRRLSV